MVFTLACGQAFILHWQFSTVTGAVTAFLLILFKYRKNITNYRKIADAQ